MFSVAPASRFVQKKNCGPFGSWTINYADRAAERPVRRPKGLDPFDDVCAIDRAGHFLPAVTMGRALGQ